MRLAVWAVRKKTVRFGRKAAAAKDARVALRIVGVRATVRLHEKRGTRPGAPAVEGNL
jgi:hypothetical protein